MCIRDSHEAASATKSDGAAHPASHHKTRHALIFITAVPLILSAEHNKFLFFNTTLIKSNLQGLRKSRFSKTIFFNGIYRAKSF